jgi:hypothetical protein
MTLHGSSVAQPKSGWVANSATSKADTKAAHDAVIVLRSDIASLAQV